MKMRPITLPALIISLFLSAEISAQATNSLRPIESSNYPFVAGLARTSLLSTVQNSNAQIAVNYLIEEGVPTKNQSLIKESVANFIGHFGPQLSDSSNPIQIVILKTIAGGKALASTLDGTYQQTVSHYFNEGVINPAKYPCMPMRGATYGAKRLIFIQAPCETTVAVSPNGDPFYLLTNSLINCKHP